MTKILITGMSGLIGGLLRQHLEARGGYDLSALNRRAIDGVRCFQADIADAEAIKPAFAGQDVVVHLAAYLGSDDWPGQLAGNVIGTYNVFEAATASYGATCSKPRTALPLLANTTRFTPASRAASNTL